MRLCSEHILPSGLWALVVLCHADRPLIVQFCSDDPDTLLRSAKPVKAHCDAVDIDLGYPQDISRRGHYGSFLQDEYLTYNMINALYRNLSVHVTVEFRVFPSIEKTVEYAKMLDLTGAQILTCHGRTHEQRGKKHLLTPNQDLASYAHIVAVKRTVSILVFTRQVQTASCLPVLYNPTLFRGLSTSSTPTEEQQRNHTHSKLTPPLPHSTVTLEYLSIVLAMHTHLALRGQRTPVRDCPARAWEGDHTYTNRIDARITAQNGTVPIENLVVKDEKTGLDILPWWIAQPYLRPLPPNVPADPHGKKAGKVKVVEAEKAKEQKELLHDSTNLIEPAVGALPAKRRPPEEIEGGAGASASAGGKRGVWAWAWVQCEEARQRRFERVDSVEVTFEC
ncbi:hypothetical protein H2248_002764 [Termitomyces sp. 'cryptogamus']|nr:hypothetical protein H2248_002764 [Termitomyces sp. 'cryptogamus']